MLDRRLYLHAPVAIPKVTVSVHDEVDLARLQELDASFALVRLLGALSLERVKALDLQEDLRHLLQHLHKLRSIIIIVCC